MMGTEIMANPLRHFQLHDLHSISLHPRKLHKELGSSSSTPYFSRSIRPSDPFVPPTPDRTYAGPALRPELPLSKLTADRFHAIHVNGCNLLKNANRWHLGSHIPPLCIRSGHCSQTWDLALREYKQNCPFEISNGQFCSLQTTYSVSLYGVNHNSSRHPL